MRGSPDHFAVRLRNRGMPAIRIALIGYAAALGLGIAGLGEQQQDVIGYQEF